MKFSKNLATFILLCLIISCGNKNETKYSETPPGRLELAKIFIKDAIQHTDTSIYLPMAFKELDSLIILFPNSKEAQIADSILKTKNSIISEIKKSLIANKEYEDHIQTKKRAEYKQTLRNYYLDQGLDIKVFIIGKSSEQLKLEFVLFNDVWFRKLETSGNFDLWAKMGFKKIIITDGYDYSKSMTYY